MKLRFCLLSLLLLGCGNSTSTREGASFPQLELLDSHRLEMAEPSGLTLGAGADVLWVVGNRPERIYKLTVDGRILDSLIYVGNDLEGIAFDSRDSTLWIVEEERREVVQLDRAGNILRQHRLELSGMPNNGLEGIGLDDQNNLYVLNEKNPGLFVSLDDDLTISNQHQLDFAPDYSGLTYDRGRDSFWITSHEDSTIYLWSPSIGVTGSLKTSYAKMEGVAIDENSKRLYVVSEIDNTLHIYVPR